MSDASDAAQVARVELEVGDGAERAARARERAAEEHVARVDRLAVADARERVLGGRLVQERWEQAAAQRGWAARRLRHQRKRR